MKKLFLAASISCLSFNALAENYQTELAAGYLDFDVADGFVLGAQYHFSQVDTSNKPLAEASFLDRSSNIALAYTDIEDFDATVIGAEFYLNSFYIAPTYTNPSVGDGVFAAAIGYVGDGWRVITTVPEEDYELNIDFKYVTKLSGDDFINFEAGYADGGDFSDDTITVVGDYYFDETFSVGALLVNADDTDFGLRINKFFTSKFSAGAQFVSGDEVDTFSLDVAVRF